LYFRVISHLIIRSREKKLRSYWKLEAIQMEAHRFYRFVLFRPQLGSIQLYRSDFTEYRHKKLMKTAKRQSTLCRTHMKVTLIFPNDKSYFSMHILVAYLESFRKHYNQIFFH